MGFLDRLKGLLGDEPGQEDPQKAINRIVRELRKHLSDGRARVAGAIRDEKRLEREVIRAQAEIQRCVREAKIRLGKGDEVGARECLARKVQVQGFIGELERELDRQREAIDTLKGGLKQLADRLQTLETRRTTLRAKVRRTRALEARKQGLGEDGMGEAEALMDELQVRLDVEEELLSAGGAGDALERRFLELEHSGEYKVKALEDLRNEIEDG